MADELNVPTHRWYEPRNNIALPPNAVSAKYILANGVALIDAWINSRPWGPYSVDGFVPPLAFDFVADYYQTDSTATTFDSALTATRAGNATMVDSDGKIKWAPHNLLTYSEQFDNAAWSREDVTVVSNATVAPDGASTAEKIVENTATTIHRIRQTYTPPSEAVHSFSFYAKAAERTTIRCQIYSSSPLASADVNLSDGTLSGVIGSADISNVGNGWYRVTISATVPAAATIFRVYPIVGGSVLYTGDGTSGIYLWGAHLYRSDLGGMVDVPADARAIPSATKYVPTTSAARYLPRRGHHVYNGSEWVNEGLLVESEARTNLFLNSATLSTQSVTVTAVPHTLSFTGTGTVTLTGVSTAGPLVGTGTGENNRVSLTFTPTAGVLLVTVTGTVSNAQLEAGSTPSSYIPTAGATVTRAAETLVIPSANLPWSSTAVSIAMDGRATGGTLTTTRWYNSSTAYITQSIGATNFSFSQYGGGALDTVTGGSFSPGVNVPFNIASRHGSTFINGAVDGVALTADLTPVALPNLSATNLQLGYKFMGTIGSFRVWADDIGDAGLVTATNPSTEPSLLLTFDSAETSFVDLGWSE